MMSNKATTAPLLVGADEVARLLSVAKSTVYSWLDSGRLPSPLRIGGRTLWNHDELQRWVQAGAPPRVKWEQVRGAAR